MKQVELTEAMSCKYPEWVVFVIAAGKDGRPDLMPAGWVMFTSGSPAMVAVSIHPKRHTHKLVEESGEFILAWAGEGQQDLVQFAGATSGRNVDKFAEKKLKTSKAAVVAAPLVEGCAMALECKVAGRMTTGDHTIFAGRIVAAHVADPPLASIMNFGQERYVAPAMKGKAVYFP